MKIRWMVGVVFLVLFIGVSLSVSAQTLGYVDKPNFKYDGFGKIVFMDLRDATGHTTCTWDIKTSYQNLLGISPGYTIRYHFIINVLGFGDSGDCALPQYNKLSTSLNALKTVDGMDICSVPFFGTIYETPTDPWVRWYFEDTVRTLTTQGKGAFAYGQIFLTVRPTVNVNEYELLFEKPN